jgi:hypothetical protein
LKGGDPESGRRGSLSVRESANQLLGEIEAFCRRHALAESTFGRQSVNDGKLCSRLRSGRNVTLETAEKIRDFMRVMESGQKNNSDDGGTSMSARSSKKKTAKTTGKRATKKAKTSRGSNVAAKGEGKDDRPFRFYDNRQKYLAFINTTNEKWKVGERASKELVHVKPRPPALRVFDAGVGDATVLCHLLRAMHRRFPVVPFLIVGKEISLEDVRLSLEKFPDRFVEHPASCIVLTNLYYGEAPWLRPRNVKSAAALNWKEVALEGHSAAEYTEQLQGLDKFLVDGWQVRSSEKTGNPIYVRPSVLVIYRKDHQFLLDNIIPKPGQGGGNYDLALASQPWRARMSAEFKVKKVLSPIVQSLAPGGRMLAVQSCGGDPALELVQKVWPNEEPFRVNRHELIKVLKQELGRDARDYNFVAGSDAKAIFQYEMHTLPSEVQQSIGTSTLFAAWNDAIYVSQIEDERLESVLENTDYLKHTADLLKKHKGLWFNDESFVVSRKG